MHPRLSHYVPILCIVLVVAGFFTPAIVGGKTFFAFDTLLGHLPWSAYADHPTVNNALITDPVNLDYPWYRFFQRSVLRGVLPFWNPTLFCGKPCCPPYHPLGFVLYSLLPTDVAHDGLLMVSMLLSGLFMFGYLRRVKLTAMSSLFGSLAWMLNGYLLVWFEFENITILAPTLPMILFFFEWWLASRTRFAFVGLASAIAYSFLSGNYNLLAYQWVFLCLYAAYRLLVGRRSPGLPRLGRSFPALCGAVSLGALCGSIFFVAHFAAFEGSQRKPLAFKELVRETGQLPGQYLLTLLFPDFFGSPADGDALSIVPRQSPDQVYNNYNEVCVYCGVIPFLLALCSLRYLRRWAPAPFYVVAAPSVVLMAMGTVLYWPLARFVPGLNLSTPTRILYLLGFCVAALSACGAHGLLTETNRRARLCVGVGVATLVVGVAAIGAVQTDWGIRWVAGLTSSGTIPSSLRHLYSPASWRLWTPLLLVAGGTMSLVAAVRAHDPSRKRFFFCCAMILTIADLTSFGLGFNTRSPRSLAFPATPAINLLKSDRSTFRAMSFGNFLHNGLAPFGIEDVGGYSSFYPQRLGEYLHLSQFGPGVPFPAQFGRWIDFSEFGSPLLDLLNATYVLLPREAKVSHPKLHLVYKGEIQIFRNTRSFARAFFVAESRRANSREEAYRLLGTFSEEDFRRLVILEGDVPGETPEAAPGAGDTLPSAVDILSYGANDIVLRVQAARAGFVVVGDNYHPQWRARVDDGPAPVFRANYIMRAVPVAAGTHEVHLSYRPRAVMVAFAASAIGWCILMVVLVGAGVLDLRSARSHRKAMVP